MPAQPDLDVVLFRIPRDLPLARLAVNGILMMNGYKRRSFRLRPSRFSGADDGRISLF